MSLEPGTSVKENLERVKARIRDAAVKAGRDPDSILVLGVTKTVEPDVMREAFDAGLRNFGENRVQEYLRKADIINRDCCWHIIGRLQTNKVKYLDQRVGMIHSLDRMELARVLDERGKKIGHEWDVLIQVNISGEDTKAGLSPENVRDFVNEASKLGNIKIKGLMTIAPYTVNPEDVRWVFRDLRKLAVDIQRERIQNINMEYLSMGMSNDFEVAVEEGANIVRVGSAIFGERV
jgi:pyridoxal phosphate enzyme (YggS family)